MKVVIYARVSTDEQNPLSQLYALREYALSRGWEVVGEYVDLAVSGLTNPFGRDQFKAAVEKARESGAALLVFSLDRISRDYAHLVEALELLRKQGVKVVSVQEEWLTMVATIPDATLSALIYDITVRALGYAYQKYVESLREKIKAGIARARAQGKHVGRPPKVPDRLIIHYVTKLRPQGVSVRAFWKMLRAEGYNITYPCVAQRVKRFLAAQRQEGVGA